MLKRNFTIFLIILTVMLILSGCSSDNNSSLEANPDNIVVNTQGEGTIITEVNGRQTEIKAQAEDGFRFLRWEGDVISTNNPEFVSNTQEKKITAVFLNEAELENGVFKLINSWGRNFGPFADGAFYMTYEAAIKNNVYVTMIEPNDNYEPQAIAVVNISHPHREDVELKVSTGDKYKKLYPDYLDNFYSDFKYDNYEFFAKGGAQPFPDNNIVIDITDLMPISGDVKLEVKNDSLESAYVENFSIEIFDNYDQNAKKVYLKDIDNSVEVEANNKKNIIINNVYTNILYKNPSSSAADSLEQFSRNYTQGDLKYYKGSIQNQSTITSEYGLRNLSYSDYKKALEDNLIQKLNTSQIAENLSSNNAVDNSSSNYFPPIGHQKTEGACTSWSIVYYTLGYYEARENNWDLSAENYEDVPKEMLLSPDFMYQLVNDGGDNGSYYIDTMAMLSNIGAPSWQNMSPDDNDHTSWGNETAWREAVKYKTKLPLYEFKVNSYDDIRAIKHLLDQGYILSIAIDGNEYFENFTENNIEYKELWTVDNYDGSSPNHANTIVGYDDNYIDSIEDISIK